MKPGVDNWREHVLLAGRRRHFMGAPLDAVTMTETLALVREAMADRRPLHHVAINVAKLVGMRTDSQLYDDVATADLINVDGTGVLWGARLCGVAVPERVTGVDLMIHLFGLCEKDGFAVFFFGAEQAVLDSLRKRLEREHPRLRVAGMRNGYFTADDEEGIVAAINKSGADCLFVALPTPRKERFVKRHRNRLQPSLVMGVGGSFDVYAGKVARAPKLLQAMGLEWLFRVAQEPRRLWRRYATSNLAFAGLLWQELRAKRVPR